MIGRQISEPNAIKVQLKEETSTFCKREWYEIHKMKYLSVCSYPHQSGNVPLSTSQWISLLVNEGEENIQDSVSVR